MSKRKKTKVASSPAEVEAKEGASTQAAAPSDGTETATSEADASESGERTAGLETEPDAGEASRDGLRAQATTDDEPAPQPEPTAEPEPAAETAPETETAPEPETETAPAAETAPETEPEPVPAPEPAPAKARRSVPAPDSSSLLIEFDSEMTVNLVGDLPLPGRDDLDEPTVTTAAETIAEVDTVVTQRRHLRGLLESLVFASDSPIAAKELARLASASQKQVKELLTELEADYSTRGIHLDEVAGGWVFRTSPQYAPFVRDLTKQKPVRLSRAQVETLAIIAYRQPITRPEIDDVRGVDSGPVLKLLLERDLVRILGKRDEPGRPLIYGSTSHFLEFFGLRSLKDLPTLREFTELSDESREAFEDELGEAVEDDARNTQQAEEHAAEGHGLGEHEAGAGAGTGAESHVADDVDTGFDDDDDDDDDLEADVMEAEEPIGVADDGDDDDTFDGDDELTSDDDE